MEAILILIYRVNFIYARNINAFLADKKPSPMRKSNTIKSIYKIGNKLQIM